MKRFLFFYCCLFILTISTQAQSTYFNNTYCNSDSISELVSNIEVIDDHFYIFGMESPNGGNWFVRKFDFNGVMQNDKNYELIYEFLWPQWATAFSKRNDNLGFFLTAEIWDTIGQRSHHVEMNLELDTLWTRKYLYSTHQSGYDVGIDTDDGTVLSGNFNTVPILGSGEGTYVQKLDIDGNIEWSSTLREEPVDDIIIKNKSLLKVDDGYIIGGIESWNEGFLQEFQGYITMIDNEGNTLWNLESEDNGLSSSWFYVLQLSNGDILCTQTVAYEEVPSLDWYNFKTKVYKLNIDGPNLYWEHEYLTDFNLAGAPLVPKETIDGGIILLGIRREVGSLTYYSSLLKLDSLGNQEWYKEYFFENCPDCRNELKDIDVAPDGGYIMSGEFSYFDQWGGFLKSWLLKVDACGDVQWEGCDIVSTEDIKRSEELLIYPNPVSDIVFVKGLDESRNLFAFVYDLQGRLISKSKVINGQIDVMHINQGVYNLHIHKNGKYFTSTILSIMR